MALYTVTIKEIVKYHVTVDADSKDDAMQKAEEIDSRYWRELDYEYSATGAQEGALT